MGNVRSDKLAYPRIIIRHLSRYIVVGCVYIKGPIYNIAISPHNVNEPWPVQPSFKLRNSKCYSASSWTFIKFSRDLQRLWSDCAYAQAGLSLCWSHIPYCWKPHVMAQINMHFNNWHSAHVQIYRLASVYLSIWLYGNIYTYTITNCRQPHGTARKRNTTITKHQEDKLSKATSSLFPIKMIAKLERA